MSRSTVVPGWVDGVVATVTMTPVMLVARHRGLVPQPGPEAVTTSALQEVDLDQQVQPPSRTVVVSALHLGYGGAVGAAYQLVVPADLRHRVRAGLVFGLLVWAMGYAGWLPLLRLMPPVTRQAAGRHVETITGHLLFGTVLALRARRRQRSRRRGTASTS